MNRFLPTSLLLGAALCQRIALAQPAAPDKTKTPTFSVAELEQFLGGRTLLSVDLKDATLEGVATALSQASGQKIEARANSSNLRFGADGKPLPVPAPLYSFSATKTELWPALRAWQLAARRAAQTAPAGTIAAPAVGIVTEWFALGTVPTSVGLSKNGAGWWLQPDNSLADGRAVQAWPFLLIANDLKRNQDGSLSDDGMNALDNPAPPPDRAAPAHPDAAPKADEKPFDAGQWSDQLTLIGKVLIDPKIRPLNLRCEVLEALDDKGNYLGYSGETAMPLQIAAPPASVPKPKLPAGSVFPAGGEINWDATFNGSAPATGFSHALKIPLRFQPGMGKKLVRLRGVLRFSIVTRSQHWETTQLDKPIDGTVFQKGAEFNVQFKGLEKTENGWSAGFAAQSRGP